MQQPRPQFRLPHNQFIQNIIQPDNMSMNSSLSTSNISMRTNNGAYYEMQKNMETLIRENHAQINSLMKENQLKDEAIRQNNEKLESLIQENRNKDKRNKQLMQQMLQTNERMANALDKLIILQEENEKLSSQSNTFHEKANPVKPAENPSSFTSDTIIHKKLIDMISAHTNILKTQSESSYPKFPKFSGKPNDEFCKWYNKVQTVLANRP